LLEARGKFDELKQIRELSEMAQIHYIRQGEAAGLGHAVAVAEPHVGDEPFAVLLGDDLIHPSVPLLPEMLRVVEKYGRSVIAAQEVPKDDISMYGCITPEPVDDNLARVRSIVAIPDEVSVRMSTTNTSGAKAVRADPSTCERSPTSSSSSRPSERER